MADQELAEARSLIEKQAAYLERFQEAWMTYSDYGFDDQLQDLYDEIIADEDIQQ